MKVSWWNALMLNPEPLLWILTIAFFGALLWWLLSREREDKKDD